MTLPSTHPLLDGRTADSALIRATRGERNDTPPVWFMRQAGRSLPEYRKSRAGTEMLDACLDPALAAEITLQPVRRHRVDAGIFFSDIVVPVLLAGVAVQIVPGRGPVFDEPIRDAAAIRALPQLDPAALDPISDAVRIVVDELGSTPLIGFGGAPFTLASYLVEGGPSKDQARARALMHTDPASWEALLSWCADVTGSFIRAQVLAGASAVQLFDSWAGSLARATYAAHVADHSRAALAAVDDLAVPRIHFGLGMNEMLDLLPGLGADVIGIDWRLPLDEANRRLGGAIPLQGNLDPALLAAPAEVLVAHVRDVVAGGAQAPAHILNLGHGVPPETDPGVLTRIVDLVHAG